MRLIVVKRPMLLLTGLLIIALIVLALVIAFNPVAETFRNSLAYQEAEKQVLSKYKVLDGEFEFSLPETWTTMNETFSGGEIVYNLYFLSEDKKIHGFVQVWDIKESLKQFIDESKKSAVGAVDFKYYRVKGLTVNNHKGYLLDYSRRSNQDGYIKAYEAFVEGNEGRIYRVSFFVEEKNWKPQNLILFNRIIRSFVIR